MTGEQLRLTRTMDLVGSQVYVVDTVINALSPPTNAVCIETTTPQRWSVALDYRKHHFYHFRRHRPQHPVEAEKLNLKHIKTAQAGPRHLSLGSQRL